MLDERLLKVAEYIIGDVLADIGSDHAYLPIYAYQNKQIKQAICGEVVEGPYQSTISNINRHGLSENIEARLGDGLSVLNGEYVQTVTICGMGGPLIAKILEEGFAHIGNRPRLILQANTYSYPIRAVIEKLGYTITAEEILKDKNHFYEIIVCDDTGTRRQYNNKELNFGPINLRERKPTFIDKLNWELEHQKKILNGIKDTDKNLEKVNDIKNNIRKREEVLNHECE
jgi:tRNA (adenine22-N1)-methyltransferase